MRPTVPAKPWHIFLMLNFIVPCWLLADASPTFGKGAPAAPVPVNFQGWNRRQAITIDHNKVEGTADLVDFPFLVTLDHLDPEMVDGGPRSALNGGGDLRFSGDAAGNDRLAVEVVEFVTGPTASNRRCQVWVKVPHLSTSTDTTIYVWYNKAGEVQPIAIDPYGSRAVWGNYYFVSHDGLYDSATGQALTVAGSPTTGTTPYGGRSWKGDGSAFSYLSDGGIDLSGNKSISIWKKNSEPTTGHSQNVYSLGNTSGWAVMVSRGDTEPYAANTFYSSGPYSAPTGDGARFYPSSDRLGWHYFTISETSPVGENELMRGDGEPTTLSPTVGYGWDQPAQDGLIMMGNLAGDPHVLHGELAEFRISMSIISPGFSDTGYNNMSGPGSFAYAGTPGDAGQSGGGGSGGGYWTRTGSDIHYGDGNVGIGTVAQTGYRLAVNGKVHAKEVKVDLDGWADYVFDRDYDLPTLEEVERHIRDRGHLADVPSAAEVARNGIELGEMDRILLKKIEELTLYIIGLRKEIEVLKTGPSDKPKN